MYTPRNSLYNVCMRCASLFNCSDFENISARLDLDQAFFVLLDCCVVDLSEVKFALY